jgi:hypothetical protein
MGCSLESANDFIGTLLSLRRTTELPPAYPAYKPELCLPECIGVEEQLMKVVTESPRGSFIGCKMRCVKIVAMQHDSA